MQKGIMGISSSRNKLLKRGFLASLAIVFAGGAFFVLVSGVSASSSLFSDNFEANNNFVSWNVSDSRWNYDEFNGHNGSQYKAVVYGDTGSYNDVLQKSVSTVGFRSVSLSYWYKIADMESSDHVYVEYSTDGTNWVTLANYTDQEEVSEWTQGSFALPAVAANNANFKIRFRANMNSYGDWFELDDVSVTATPMASAANSVVAVSGNYVPTQGGVATITITVKDASGNPIAGIPASDIVVSATGSGNTVTGPIGSTDASGKISATLQSTVNGVKTISVSVAGVTLSNQPQVEFYTSQPVKANISADQATTEASLSGTTVNLTITVTDSYGNVVPDGVVVNLSGTASAAGTVTIGGSESTVNGQVTRTVAFNNKGDVTLKVNAYSGNLALTGDSVIHFIDTTKPVIAAHGDESAEATSHAGATVVYDLPTATDNIDGSVAVTCEPVSDSTFAFGDTTVTCQAKDSSNNVQTSTFTVHITDTQVPTITAPVDVTVEAEAALTEVDLDEPTVSDISDADPEVTNDAPEAFPVGTTIVTWMVTDHGGNSATATQSVTVTDETKPTIDQPNDISDVEAAVNPVLGAVVEFDAPTSHDLVDGDLLAVCAPASGSTFFLGETTVTCTKTDAAGNEADAVTFTVTVIDSTSPSFSDLAPASDALIKADYTVSYTISEQLASGSIEFHSDVMTYALTGDELAIGSHTISQASLASQGIYLTDGVHSITFNGADMSGNTGTATNSGITYDATAPTVVNVTSDKEDDSYAVGTIIPIGVEFSETVLVSGEPTLQLGVGADRYALYAGASDPDGSGSEPLETLANVTQVTDTAGDESEVDVAEKSGVIHRVYVRGGNVYYSSSAKSGEELIGAGSSPSIAVGPNGVAQVVYVSAGNVMFTTKADWNAATVVSAGNSPDIDVDGSNNAHVVLETNSDGDSYVEIKYAQNSSGTFASQILYDGDWYYSSGFGTGRYYSNPKIKVDSNSKYHIVLNHQGRDSAPGWVDNFYSTIYTTNAGSGFNSSGPNGTLSKNSLMLDSSGKVHIVYNSGGIKYADPSTASWTLTSVGSGSTPSIATDGTKVGITYNDGGVKFIKNDGDGFSEPELIDASGSNQALVMGEYTYAYYLKAGNSSQDIFFATNKPASTGSGTKLNFNYTVVTDDVSADLDYVAFDSLKLNGGSIKDPAGNDANLTLAAPGTANSLGANKAIVIDAVAPVIAFHADVTAEATSPAGAVVEYDTPTAEDVFDGSVEVSCTPASDTQFDLGTAVITCTASDELGNTTTSNFNVIVKDTTAPEITAPSDVEQVANGYLSTVELDTATATDIVDIEVNITNDAPATFPVGTTVVTWTATDDYGNSATATQNVTVLPAEIVKLAVSGTSPVDTSETSIITVTGRDEWNHITTNQSGSTVIVSVDNGGSLGSPMLTLENGTAETTLNKSTAGIVNITVSSGSLTPASTQVEFTPADVTAPYVTAISPANGATDVAVSAPLFVTFSEALDSDTVNSDNIKLMQVGICEEESEECVEDSQVSAVVSLVEGGKRVNIDIDGNLAYASASYYFVVTGVADKAGNVITETIGKSNSGFSTAENIADVTAPTVVAYSPISEGSDVALDAKPYVDFSESMKATTLTTANIELRKVSDNSVVPASISVENGGTRAVINPAANLELDTAYYIFVSGEVEDEAGNAMGTDYSSGSFTTVADSSVLAVTGISATKSFGTADNTWANGWSWTFDITAPTDETALRMKFADFVSGSNVIPAAGNVRIYSAQSYNAASAEDAIVIEEANAYGSSMYLEGNLDADKMGRQIQVTVEVRIPTGSVGGSYSTSYGVITENNDR